MASTKNFRKTALNLISLSILFTITLAYATTEDNYITDNNFLTDISESTHTENGYKANIIVNPDVVGIYAQENGYKLDLAINPQGIGGSLKENGYKLDLIPEKSFPELRRDIAITNVVVSKSVVTQNYTVFINVTIENQGDFTETFNVTTYYDSTAIETQNVTSLNPNSNITLTFNWNTTGVSPGNYIVSAQASIVPGETEPDIADNTLTNGIVKIVVIIKPPPVHIASTDYPITIESNVTITNVIATKNTLHFTTSGPTGATGYINTTIPVGLNKTAIKVFVNNVKLDPPPFPIITTNGTHYFIYFEFTLSIHDIIIQYAIADIAITNVAPTKSVVGKGYTMRLNTIIQNQGHYEETFNITIYANSTSITSQSITLPTGNSTTITFTWNTTGFTYGNYTISALADILLGETNTTDNTYANGVVFVTIPGDASGDGFVDISDFAILGKAWFKGPSHPDYNPNVDFNNDNFADVLDFAILGKYWFQHI